MEEEEDFFKKKKSFQLDKSTTTFDDVGGNDKALIVRTGLSCVYSIADSCYTRPL